MDITKYLSKTINMYFGKVEEGYSYVNKNVGLWDSLIVYYFIILVSVLISTLTDVASYQQFGNNMMILIFGLIVLSIIIMPIGILIGYGLIHLFLIMFGGKASFSETIKFAISASIFSAIVGTLVSAITNLLMTNVQNLYLTIAYSLVMLVVSLALGIWALIVMTRVLSLAHKISPGKTLLAILLPAFIFMGIVFIIMIFIGLAIGMSAI